MKTEMTPRQAMTLYSTLEALLNQFDRENDPNSKGDCASCNAADAVMEYRCKKCGYLGSPKGKNTYAAVSNDQAQRPRTKGAENATEA